MKFFISGRGAAALVACAALPLCIAACSSSGSGLGSGSGSGGSSAAASPTTTAAPASADPNAGLPTGAQLKADLVGTGIPAGYTLDASGRVDTGSYYQAPSAAATSPCADLDGTSWINLADRSSVSFAQNDYIDQNASEEFAQEIDAFQGTTAQDVMTTLSRIAAKCPTFNDSQTSSTVKVSVATHPSPGDGAVVITLSDPKWVGSITLEAVRVGHSVVTVLSSADSGSAAFAQSMASQIAAKLSAAGKQ